MSKKVNFYSVAGRHPVKTICPNFVKNLSVNPALKTILTMERYPSFQEARERIRIWSEHGLSTPVRLRQARRVGVDRKLDNDLMT